MGIASAIISKPHLTAVVVAVILGSVLAAANSPLAPPPPPPPVTVTILSPFEILEPSTGQENNANHRGDDKDGFPPQSSSADPEEFMLQIHLVLTEAKANPVMTLIDFNIVRDDNTIDNDNGRDLDLLDGVDDNSLAVGTYNVYFNLNKTGYAPKDTAPLTSYVAPFVSSATDGLNGAIEKYQARFDYTGGPTLSNLFTVTNANSASINQSDLDWLDTAPETVSFEVGDSFEVRSKYKQSSAENMKHFMTQAYYVGSVFRLTGIASLYYNNVDPGPLDISVPPPAPTTNFSNDQYLDSSQLPPTLDNSDFWITRYFFTKIGEGPSPIRPYVQTRGGGNAWKTDSGYVEFFGIVNPAILDITKVFSDRHADGVVSGPNPPIVGQTTTYELLITVENIGEDNAVFVNVTDTIPADVTCVCAFDESQGTASYSAPTVTWNVGTLAPTASATLYFQVSVTPAEADLDTKILLNAGASANGKSESSNDPISDGPTPGLETAPVTGILSMSLTKEADVTTADPNDTIVYTLAYENTGHRTAYSVVVRDTIPAQTTWVDSDPDHSFSSGDEYTWNLGNIAAGGMGTIEVTVTVDNGTADTTLLVNEATLDFKNSLLVAQTTLHAWDNVTVTAPVMTFSKGVDHGTADPGDTLQYTLTYNNGGTGVASDVVVKDQLPADVTLDSAFPAPDTFPCPANLCTWTIGTVGAGLGGTILINVTVNVGTEDGTSLLNTATLRYSDANHVLIGTLFDDATTLVTAPEMTFVKTVNHDTADPGDTIIYTLSYENEGTGEATDIRVVDVLPDEVTFVTAVPALSGQFGQTLYWNFTPVIGGGSGAITITVKVDAYTPDETVMTNTATLRYKDANGNFIEELESSVDVTVTAPDMTIDKSATVSYADPGDSFNYTLAYFNDGSGVAEDVLIVDILPAGVSYVSADPSPTSVGNGVLIWKFTSVPGDTGGTIQVKVMVASGLADGATLHNCATLDYEDDNDNDQGQESDCFDVTVTAPAMTFSKAANATTADPGDLVKFYLNYTNGGSGNATNVVVKDTLPAAVDFLSAVPGPDGGVCPSNVCTWTIANVGPNVSGSIQITVRVNISAQDGATLLNAATLRYSDANGIFREQLSAEATVTVTRPKMTINKTADVTTADPGDLIVYTLAYDNAGTGEATSVVIKDTLPADVSFVSAVPTPDGGTCPSGVCTWTIPSVPGGDNGTITVTVRVNAGVPDGRILTNGVTLDYDDANGNGQARQSDSVDVRVTAPIGRFRKVADVTLADPGDLITYTLTFTNIGTGNASNVWINDTIPADTTYVSSTPAPTSNTSTTYRWNFANVGPGGTAVVTLVVKVKPGTPDRRFINNTATADYSDANGNFKGTLSDGDGVTVTAPLMSITKEDGETFADPGDIFTYTITYRNTGSGVATGVVIVDTLPSQVTVLNETPPPTNISGLVHTWTIGTVAPGNVSVITIRVRVNVGTPDQTLVENIVVMNSSDANGNPLPQRSAEARLTVRSPVFTFTKTANVSEADPGDTITYTLQYKNIGSGRARGVIVNDTIPVGTTFVSSNPPYFSFSGSTYRWNVGTVVANATGTITVVVRVDAGLADGTPLVNTATLDYSDDNNNFIERLTDDARTTVTAPVLTIIKTVDVSTADPSDLLTYTITYKNIGSGVATGVEITDTLPPNTTFVDASPPEDFQGGSIVFWIIGTVGPGGEGTLTLRATVDAYTADGTVLLNVANLTFKDANGNPRGSVSDDAMTVVTAPTMTFRKDANVTTADPGDLILYTITLKNTGSGVATNVTVDDTLPPGITVVGFDPDPDDITCPSGVCTWTFPIVNPNQTIVIRITVRVNAGVPDQTTLHNAAVLNFDDDNGNPFPRQDEDADVTVTAPRMTVEKRAAVTEADPGDSFNYTIAYKNHGSGNATGVVIVDTLPAGVTFVSADPAPDGGTCPGGVCTWTIGTVAGGANGTIHVRVTVDVGLPDRTLLRNGVVLRFRDDNGNPYDDVPDTEDVIVTAPVFTFSKAADVGTADPDDLIVYTLEWRNTGSGVATLVAIVDTLPADVSFVTASPLPDGGSCPSNVCTWTLGTVAAGANGTITVTVRVDEYVADQTPLLNSATLEYSDANGNLRERLTREASVIVTAPRMMIQKDVDLSQADPGDVLVYTLTYRNLGTGEATGVVIRDAVPLHTSFVDATPATDTGDCPADLCTWTFLSVAGGGSGSITVRVQIDAGVADGTEIPNTATLDYDDANGNPYGQVEDSAETTITAPEGALVKVASADTADPGDLVNYTLTFTNEGTGNATNVWLNDTLPDDVDFVSSDPGYTSFSGQTYRWRFALVGPGQTVQVNITVRVDAFVADDEQLHNAATAEYADDNGNFIETLDAFDDVEVTAPIVTVTKDASADFADPGDVIVYTIVVKNDGDGGATGLNVTDLLPSATSFLDSDPAPHGVSDQMLYWNFTAMGPNSQFTIVVRVTVVPGTADHVLLHNVACVVYRDANGNAYPQGCDGASTFVTAPVITFTKTADVATADPGDTIVYTLTVANSGTGDADNVFVVDTLPTNITLVSIGLCTMTDLGGGVHRWDIGLLEAGDSVSCPIIVKVNAYTEDRLLLQNVAVVSYTDANDNGYDPIEDTAETRVTAPILSVEKAASVDEADPGDPIMYTITYTNSGTGAAFGVVIVDVLPDDVTFQNANPATDTGICPGQVCTWTIGTVPGLSSGKIYVNVTVKLRTGDQTDLNNGVSLHFEDPNGNPYPDPEDNVTSRVTAPVMEFEKNGPDTEVTPGDIVVFTITYRNIGTGSATNVTIVDTIPAQFSVVSILPPPDFQMGLTLTWLIGTVGPGEGGTITIQVQVLASTPDNTLVTNTATLDYGDANGNPYPRLTDNAWVLVVRPVMTFDKRAPEFVAPGEEFDYILVYENLGLGSAVNVVVSDTLPAGLSFVSSDPAPTTASDPDYEWVIPLVPPESGGLILIRVRVDLPLADGTPLGNSACLDYTDRNDNSYDEQCDRTDSTVVASSIGDYVWHDLDLDGAQDLFEPPIAGAGLTLSGFTSWGDPVLLPITTDFTTGYYDYLGLGPGNYSVSVDVPAGWAATTPPTVAVALGFDDHRTDVDFGVAEPRISKTMTPLSSETRAYVIADLTLRVAGEKWHSVEIWLNDSDGDYVGHVRIVREPGSPDDQSQVVATDLFIDTLTDDLDAVVLYTPEDDPVNGQWWGANPAWLILTFPDGSESRIKHTFNVRHQDTWRWEVDDFRPYLEGQPVVFETLVTTSLITITATQPFASAEIVDLLPPELVYSGDGFGNDADGLVDEELYDNLDNDGDTRVDEDRGGCRVNGAFVSGPTCLLVTTTGATLPRGLYTIAFETVTVESELEINELVRNTARIMLGDAVMAEDVIDFFLLIQGHTGDGIDNDGDGDIDEEELDFADNDGDGYVDEDLGPYEFIAGGGQGQDASPPVPVRLAGLTPPDPQTLEGREQAFAVALTDASYPTSWYVDGTRVAYGAPEFDVLAAIGTHTVEARVVSGWYIREDGTIGANEASLSWTLSVAALPPQQSIEETPEVQPTPSERPATIPAVRPPLTGMPAQESPAVMIDAILLETPEIARPTREVPLLSIAAVAEAHVVVVEGVSPVALPESAPSVETARAVIEADVSVLAEPALSTILSIEAGLLIPAGEPASSLLPSPLPMKAPAPAPLVAVAVAGLGREF